VAGPGRVVGDWDPNGIFSNFNGIDLQWIIESRREYYRSISSNY
jgi:hypothetical protein